MTVCPPSVIVEKRKWDGSVATRSEALLLSGGADVVCWFTRAGTVMDRPRKGRSERAASDEAWMSGGRFWIASCTASRNGPGVDYRVDVGLSPQPPLASGISFVDLDLDLIISGGHIRVRDVSDFAGRAVVMHYPPRVIIGAVRGLIEAMWRVRTQRWPFDGCLAARLQEGAA